MKVTVETVNYISKLAKLKFTDEEAKKLAEEFESILTHFESIDKVDLSDIDLNIFSDKLKSVLRKDETTLFKNKEKLFSNTTSMRKTAIIVPKIIE